MSKSIPNYFQVLGVFCDADAAELKNAFRNQAHKTHPDRGGQADTFRLVKLAYDTLSDPKLRAEYERIYQADAKRRGLIVCPECFGRASRRAARCRECSTYFVSEQEGQMPPVLNEAVEEGSELIADVVHWAITLFRSRLGVPPRGKHGPSRS